MDSPYIYTHYGGVTMSSTEYSKHLNDLEKIHHETVEILKNSRPLDVSSLRKNGSNQATGFSWREGLIVGAAILLGLYLGIFVL